MSDIHWDTLARIKGSSLKGGDLFFSSDRTVGLLLFISEPNTLLYGLNYPNEEPENCESIVCNHFSEKRSKDTKYVGNMCSTWAKIEDILRE